MALSANAGDVWFWLENKGREHANPPIVFPDMTTTNKYAFSIWVFLHNNIPIHLMAHREITSSGAGSEVIIGHDGTNWYMYFRRGTVVIKIETIAPLLTQVWTAFHFDKDGPNYKVYMGFENNTIPNWWQYPTALTHVKTISTEDLEFEFGDFVIRTYSNIAISNFKFWNDVVGLTSAQYQVNRWDDATDGAGPAPFWASPLRSPYDISNIANPSTGPYWAENFAWSPGIWGTDPNNLQWQNDNSYMWNNQFCPAWIHPIDPNAASVIAPAMTPPVDTVYKSNDFWSFKDVGAITWWDANFGHAKYFGYMETLTPGVPPIKMGGLFRDENGDEIAPDMSNSSNVIISGQFMVVPDVKATTIYLWKFGAQFEWAGQTPEVPAAQTAMKYLKLLGYYKGPARGQPFHSLIDLTGLFAVQKNATIDSYNRGVQVKIPDPTIRTALIGE